MAGDRSSGTQQRIPSLCETGLGMPQFRSLFLNGTMGGRYTAFASIHLRCMQMHVQRPLRRAGCRRINVGAMSSSAELHRYGARDLTHLVKGKEVSACDVVKHYLERIESIDGDVKSFLFVNAESAVDQVGDVENAAWSTMGSLSPLLDVPCRQKQLTKSWQMGKLWELSPAFRWLLRWASLSCCVDV